jgi:hypothetical protein
MPEAWRMSRFSGMTPRAKRAWGIGLILFFILLCGMIGFSEWWAYNVNVPHYEHAQRAGAPH